MAYLRTRIKADGTMVVEVTTQEHAGEFVLDSAVNMVSTIDTCADLRASGSVNIPTYYIPGIGNFQYSPTGSYVDSNTESTSLIVLQNDTSGYGFLKVNSNSEILRLDGKKYLTSASIHLGKQAICGWLGHEFVACNASDYIVDGDLIISSSVDPNLVWVWKNPETGRLGFAPSDSPTFVDAVTADWQRSFPTTDGAALTALLPERGPAAQESIQGTPTLDFDGWGGTTAIQFTTSHSAIFVAPPGCQPNGSWGFILASQAAPTDVTGGTGYHAYLEIARADGNNRYMFGPNGADVWSNGLTIATVAETIPAQDQYRGPVTACPRRAVRGFFASGPIGSAYKIYQNGRSEDKGTKANAGLLLSGSTVPRIYLNRYVANTNYNGTQVFKGLYLYSGEPSDSYKNTLWRYLINPTPDINVVCWGDSITFGGSLTNAQTWPTLLQANATITTGFTRSGISGSYEVENYGHSGWCTAQLLYHWDHRAGSYDDCVESRCRNGKTIVIVAIGVNDLFRSRTATQIATDLAALGRRISAAGAYGIIQDILPSTALSGASATERISLNSLIAANYTSWGYKANVVLSGITGLSDPTNASYYPDGTHPSASSTALMVAPYAAAISAAVVSGTLQI